MKIAFLFIVIPFLHVSAMGYGQDKFSLKLEQVDAAKVLLNIQQKSDYRFFFLQDDIKKLGKIDINVTDATVQEILQQVLGNVLAYKILNRNLVVISPNASALADKIEVHGKILDEAGAPLIGVTVKVKGQSIGVVTKVDGSFSLAVDEKVTLEISFMGFEPLEIPVNGKSELGNIVLKASTSGLNEVVVVGYGTQKKVNLTGAIGTIKPSEIGNIPASNLSNLLAGRAAGVTVVGSTGLAGASSSIRMRGSFADPLYVINGIIKGKADFDALDASEVESINFLKDAATASVYGSKAGNGVVLVVTKTGTVQKPTFEYKGSYSTSRPTKPIQSYTATEEIEFNNQVDVTLGNPKRYGQEIYDYFKDKSYSINDYIWQNPTVQQHNLAVRGGTETLSYYLSLGYHDEEGSYKNLNFGRYNFRSDVTARISKRFKINVNLSGNQRNYHRWYWPYDGAEDFNVGDFYRATFNWTRLYPFYVDDAGNPTTNTNENPVVPGAWHPVELMLNSGGYRDIKKRTLDGIIRLDLDLADITEGLSTSFQAHYNGYDQNMKSFVVHNKAYIFQPAAGTNKFVPGPIDPTKINLHNLSANYPNIQHDVNFYNSYQINWNLKYERTFGKHAVSALAVYEQGKDNGNNLTGRADQLLTTAIDQIYNASQDASRRWFTGNETMTARASWIGRANYIYNEKYIAEFSFRYDGNYKFAPGHRWGFFPSVSAAWRISEENFIKANTPWLSNLKLRGSYGTSGNDDVNAFYWSQTYAKNTGYVFGTTLNDGIAPGPMPNPIVTWSTSNMLDIGLDYGFLGNRLTGEIDFFTRKQWDILGTRDGSTPSTLGATPPSLNYAQRSWKGFEISAGWSDRIGELSYSIYGNVGYAKDKWDLFDEAEALHNGTYKDNWRSILGQPNDRVYGLISKGIIRSQADLDKLPAGFTQYGRIPKPGYLLFEDIRGANFSEGPDGKIDDNDMTYLSTNGSPRMNYGVGFRLEWKGIGLNAHFQGVGAYDRMISTRNGGGVFQNDRPYFEIWARDYWTPENPDAKYPRVSGEFQVADVGGGASSFWLRNGAYLRLKNLDLTYTLPKKWLSRIGVTNVQLFTNAANLFYISGLKEHDPEQLTLDSYPLMKTFTGGAYINF
ncbi:TonB-dependent receptor [Chitinophaga sp. SYP-B3965]|uniref:TonB-dependent receptor n=1 Tax=Chitinophaga sp. SYP-B3965 TaxID=2663120 RepID=UPI0015645787|nr:TonB-dependent receptor [Chitinophaga sp. SYP-B3965]